MNRSYSRDEVSEDQFSTPINPDGKLLLEPTSLNVLSQRRGTLSPLEWTPTLPRVR